jgi:transcriptional regulator with XRE-family HTH domain
MRSILKYDVDIGFIKARMITLGMTPTQLGEASGMEYQRIYRFFKGDNRTLDTIHKIATALGSEVAEFVTPIEPAS